MQSHENQSMYLLYVVGRIPNNKFGGPRPGDDDIDRS